MRRAVLLAVLVFVVVGCGELRFAPGQEQKENAWLHNRTAAAAAEVAAAEGSSAVLVDLTELSELQSRAFVGYFGMPDDPGGGYTVDQILAEHSYELARRAGEDALVRPDPWAVADGVFELAIGAAALFGGVYGSKAVRALKDTREKSVALREIIEGNELFKRRNSGQVSAFKAAQSHQSASTKKLVAQMKG